ncbi:hypothetical protein ACQSED_25275 [Salmonella enterica]|uniref:hypothetical protein n=1 Tax=Salmonella enterica TaxID=28901 RepID=UPI003D312A94
MKLTVGDIRFSESGYASATVGVGAGTFPFLLFSICKMDVSVPVVNGKAIKDYDEDLKNKAREVITKMYKEIVCGGETNEASGLLDYLSAKTEPSEFSCKVKLAINDDATNKDLEERVALLEKRLGEQTSPDMLKAIHEVSKKAAQGFLNQAELKKKIAHDINGESSTFYNPDGTVRLQVGRLNDKHDEYTRIEATFPVMKYPRLITEKGIFDIKKIPRIGGKVEITLSEGNVLSLEYEEDYDPATTLEGYEARAKEYASRVMSEIKKAH